MNKDIENKALNDNDTQEVTGGMLTPKESDNLKVGQTLYVSDGLGGSLAKVEYVGGTQEGAWCWKRKVRVVEVYKVSSRNYQVGQEYWVSEGSLQLQAGR